MTPRMLGTTTKLACVAMAVALVAVLGGCSLPVTRQSSEGTTTIGAPSPQVAPGAPSDGGALSGTANSYGGAPAADAAKGGAGTTAAPVEKLIVVNKTLRIETKDVDGTITKIRDLTARDGADITNMQVATAVDQPIYPMPLDSPASSSSGQSVPLRAFVTIRVPSSKYAAFVADAAKLGRVLFQSESTDDVTQQHVDMQARLGNLQAEQARLRQLFAKAKNVSDMLAIEQELTRVQGDIESMQAQIAYLERQAAMATVTIELTEPVAIGSPAGIDWGVSTALTDAVRAFVRTMNGLIVLLGPVLAILVFVGLPVWLIVWLVRRAIRSHKSVAAPTETASGPSTPGSGDAA